MPKTRLSGPPLISVVTPTKNRLALLTETIASVRAQTLTDWEHIVVDDGSNDGTETYVTELARTDPRIRYVRRQGEACGANACRNLGIREARSDLLVFLDSDDILTPGALGRRAHLMARNLDLDFLVFSTGAFVREPGDVKYTPPDVLGDDLLAFLLFATPWQTTACTWRRAALERLGGWDEALPSWQDIDLHLRALAGRLRYLRYPDIDHYMRWQLDPTKISIQQRHSPEHLAAAERTLVKFERVLREGPGMTWMRQRALCALYFFVARRWAQIGHLREGLGCWRQIRVRRLGPALLHLSGAMLLVLDRWAGPLQGLTQRVIHRWGGWARFRVELHVVPD